MILASVNRLAVRTNSIGRPNRHLEKCAGTSERCAVFQDYSSKKPQYLRIFSQLLGKSLTRKLGCLLQKVRPQDGPLLQGHGTRNRKIAMAPTWKSVRLS